MASNNHSKLAASALTAIYPMYLAGALYIVYPVMAWFLFGKLFLQRLRGQSVDLHPVVVLWLVSMFAMLIVLIMGHLDWQLGTAATIKSAVGWAKGWALLAVFMAVGALVTEREVLVRAACVVGRWTLFLAPIFLACAFVGVPDTLYVSPLKVLGGSTAEYFTVSLYEMDPGFGIPRLRMFAPWAPAIGLMGNVLLLLCLLERNRSLRIQGVLGALVMIVLSLSRLGWIVAVLIPGLLFVLANIKQWWLWVAGGLLSAAFAIVGLQVIEAATSGYEQLKGARSDSTIVRQYLADIAVSRWRDEAPIWGHGRVEAGPHLVQYMMIGSHHTWYGLLFVKGIMGVCALAVPLVCTFLCLLRQAYANAEVRTALGLVAVLGLYSFGENLEVLPYLYWPGLVFVGSVLHDLELQHD